jgi:parallel beta-helix repeat protein
MSDEESKIDNYAFFSADYKLKHDDYFYKGNKLDLEFDESKEKIKNYSLSFSQANESTSDTYNIEDGLRIPIGSLVSNGKPFHFKIACGTENYHAIIGGQSGKGKSVLLNTLIRRGIGKYPSSALKFMLFDCKGVEFNDFEIDDYIIERESTPDVHVIMEKLKLIDEEFKKRRELFKEHNVKSIEQLVSKGVELYRLVCIVDEFQFLFPVADYKISQFSEDLLVSKILRTGRSFGIHLIVATQSLGDGVRGSILNNIPLRIALGMTEWQSASFLASNNTVAKNLERGMAIYNGNNGELASNELIKVDKVD